MKQEEITVWLTNVREKVSQALKQNEPLHTFLNNNNAIDIFVEAVTYELGRLVKLNVKSCVQAENMIGKYMPLTSRKVEETPIYYLIDWYNSKEGYDYWDQLEINYLIG